MRRNRRLTDPGQRGRDGAEIRDAALLLLAVVVGEDVSEFVQDDVILVPLRRLPLIGDHIAAAIRELGLEGQPEGPGNG